MKNYTPPFLLIMGVTLIWAACSKSDELSTTNSSSKRMVSIRTFIQPEETIHPLNGSVTRSSTSSNRDNVHIEITPADAITRTSMSGSTASFTSGDVIGVYESTTNKSNVAYTYNGTSWSASTPIYWQNSTYTYYAYYPYQATSGTLTNKLVPLPLLSAQSFTNTPAPAQDMLVANSVALSTSTISLTFKHAFSLLKFNIYTTNTTSSGRILKSVTVTGGNLSTSSSPYGLFNNTSTLTNIAYSFASNSFQIGQNTSSTFNQAQTTTMNLPWPTGQTLLTIYALVMPGTYTSPQPSLQITFMRNSTQYAPSAVKLPTNTFVSGAMHTFNVNITFS